MSDGLELGLFGRRRIRLIAQTEMTECGLAALAMIANFHGMKIDLGTLRQRFQVSLRGMTLQSLMGVADTIGLTTRALKLPLDHLSYLKLPAILHWDLTHFVVVESVRGDRVLIHDPEGRTRWLSINDLSEHFSGVALELQPANDFAPTDQRIRLRLSQLWSHVSGLKRAMLQTLALSLVLQAFVLASPYYMQVAIDTALPALDLDLLVVLALGFGLFTIFNAAATLLRSFVLLSAGTSLGYGLSINVARRLFRLPIPWFERRHVGDILSRFQSITPIRQFMTEGAVSSALDGVMTIFIVVVMFLYSPQLTIVALTAFLLYFSIRLVSFVSQRRAQEDAISLNGREQSTMIETIRGIVTLRLFNREAARHAFWQTQLTDAANSSVSLGRIGAWQSAANTLILGLETIVSIYLAVRLVITGGFSVGMVIAFMAYKTQFLQRAISLIDQVVAFRMLGLHLERLSDIVLTDEDVSFATPGMGHAILRGQIDVRGVSFRYNPSEPLILDKLDLSIAPGEHIAITGPSGGGKSTLVKILLGLLRPEAGEVLFDGVPLDQFGPKRLYDQLGVVLQEDSLFAGSLIDNVALFDDQPDVDRVIECCTLAALHVEIQSMPMQYETLVGDMGSSLSGGQRQRLLLARALYRRPRLLIVDEGTSHLDAAREDVVNAAIAGLGITRVIIAHRLETIVSATRIYDITRGRIKDSTEAYALIKTQLALRTITPTE